MKFKNVILPASLVLLVAVVLPIYAHHPFAAQFDSSKPVTLSGTVTKVDWANPHAHIFMDVKDTSGETANWEFELGGLKKIGDLGWKKNTVKMGDQLTINGWKARDGSKLVSANTVTLSNGNKLAAGSSYFDHAGEKAPVSE